MVFPELNICPEDVQEFWQICTKIFEGLKDAKFHSSAKFLFGQNVYGLGKREFHFYLKQHGNLQLRLLVLVKTGRKSGRISMSFPLYALWHLM